MRYKIHLFYGVLIVALGSWLAIEKTKEHGRELNLATGNTLRHLSFYSEKEMLYDYSEMQKLYLDYPGTMSLKFSNKMTSLQDISNRFQHTIQGLADSIKNHKMEQHGLGAILQDLTSKFQDSLSELADHEEYTLKSMPELMLKDSTGLNPDWVYGYLESAQEEELQLILANIRARARFSELAVFHNLASKINFCGGFIADKYSITNSMENSTPRVGDWYSAKIGLSICVPQLQPQMRIQVDDQMLPVTNGVSEYRQRYTTPGVKKYTAGIHFFNEFTGRMEVLKREFSVTVVDSCR
jgi:hypothetical protein